MLGSSDSACLRLGLTLDPASACRTMGTVMKARQHRQGYLKDSVAITEDKTPWTASEREIQENLRMPTLKHLPKK